MEESINYIQTSASIASNLTIRIMSVEMLPSAQKNITNLLKF